MQVITNLQNPVGSSNNPSFPEGGILAITTSQPEKTEFLTLEVRDSNGNVIEIGQVDPEFDPSNEVLQRKLQVAGRTLKGTTISIQVNWADSSGEEYSQGPTKVDVV